ncbi:2-phospho-L-lactate transferase [Methanobrevibacter sp. TMH8]|uniref:2-phospho-L-lactate transferase n=1 Tax=Methanobrevibacter sp. TMH8 TaxID=2848611 RepID=UPI001CC97CA6|nr:2-phospho-L-lactate transferase [Methanobrevibacter sp. TMH8]MBZ9571205.1 2-phospho-L-lactate transferase [Methanobrevibacter sp. TMH8]
MITILSGGTGTPKLIQGIKEIYDPSNLSIIVNTVENDYFSGVYVAADIDTVLYTLSDKINDETWYGIKEDTFITNEKLKDLGCPELLKIGDQDRATKIQKTELMKNHSLSEAVDIQRTKMGITSKILPMSDEHSKITVSTDIGKLEFHDFLIKHQTKPEVLSVDYTKVNSAPNIVETIEKSEKVIIGPSNPITSILPIVNLEGVEKALKNSHVIAISPIIGDAPVSGPAGKFMDALGHEVSSFGVASIYKSFLDTFIIDIEDENKKTKIETLINKVITTNTNMKTINDKKNLAKIVLNE